MASIITKYNKGDTVFTVCYSTVSIYQHTVTAIHVGSSLSNDFVSYNLIRTSQHAEYDIKLEYIDESLVLTFQEAKDNLLTWLNRKVIEVQSLKQPA